MVLAVAVGVWLALPAIAGAAGFSLASLTSSDGAFNAVAASLSGPVWAAKGSGTIRLDAAQGSGHRVIHVDDDGNRVVTGAGDSRLTTSPTRSLLPRLWSAPWSSSNQGNIQ